MQRRTLRSRTRRILTTTVATAVLVGTFATTAPTVAGAQSPGWEIGPVRLDTPWTAEVSPDNALPEYPRPQLVRREWQNLNGVWEFAGATEGEAPPFGRALAERVLVPYPIESALSGITRHEDHMWYRRQVSVPANWRVGSANQLMLHFGAVDYDAVVYVNGQEVTRHRGGFGAFSADITAAISGRGPQEVVVGVTDRGDATFQPVGKQRLRPDRGIFYEGASGIWQTVWMEPVAARGHIERLNMTPDIDTDTLALTVRPGAGATGTDLNAQVVVSDGNRTVTRTEIPVGVATPVRVPDAKLWSPDSPFLYDLEVTLRDGNRPLDRTESYFGMREIGTAPGADGRMRMTLNGEPLFQMSTLDQGYWPDGIYTAPTDEALAFDLAETKALGFNTVRKHIKTEPDRWYHHADRLGLLVWQDMPAMRTGARPPVDAQQQFERELDELVDEKKDWTSIIGWVPFNEGWGEWNREATGRIADEVKAQDPSRLVNAHSGVNCCDSLGDSGRGDVLDHHAYYGPATPQPDARRASMDGEHGGYGLEVDGHMWFGEGHAYGELADTSTELTDWYVDNQRDVLAAARSCAISGAVYTQITDVEHEVNGFYTYDRDVKKMEFDRVRQINQQIVEEGSDSGTTPPPADPGTPGTAGVHAYPFDETSGTVADDAVGDANLTVAGGQWVQGVDGNALALSGDGQADAGRPLINTDGSYSVSAWAKLDVVDGAFQTVVSQDSDPSSAFFLQYSGADQRWAMSFVNTRALSDVTPVVGQWYHLTGVRDATAGTLTLYVDGQRQGQVNACALPAEQGTTVVGRGQFNGDPVDYLRGAVDDVRIFDRALAPDEIATLAATRG